MYSVAHNMSRKKNLACPFIFTQPHSKRFQRIFSRRSDEAPTLALGMALRVTRLRTFLLLWLSRIGTDWAQGSANRAFHARACSRACYVYAVGWN